MCYTYAQVEYKGPEGRRLEMMGSRDYRILTIKGASGSHVVHPPAPLFYFFALPEFLSDFV